jgi:hypothetical protein
MYWAEFARNSEMMGMANRRWRCHELNWRHLTYELGPAHWTKTERANLMIDGIAA